MASSEPPAAESATVDSEGLRSAGREIPVRICMCRRADLAVA